MDKLKKKLNITSDDFQKSDFLENYLSNLNKYLQKFKNNLTIKNKNYPIIYVVGLPRSGTTLLSQLLSRYLSVGYINNLIARFWMNPEVGIRISETVIKRSERSKIKFKSIQGVSEEPWGPHEFGYFWSHWLKLDDFTSHKLSNSHLLKVDKKGLKKQLKTIINVFQSPVVFKNIICGLQASFLSSIHPNSLFILIERDTKSVASSILKCRKQRFGNERIWWSVKPSSYSKIIKIESPIKQIKCQILDTSNDLNHELEKPNVNCIRIKYEDLCSNPFKKLQMIRDKVSTLGYSLDFTECKPKIILK